MFWPGFSRSGLTKEPAVEELAHHGGRPTDSAASLASVVVSNPPEDDPPAIEPDARLPKELSPDDAPEDTEADDLSSLAISSVLPASTTLGVALGSVAEGSESETIGAKPVEAPVLDDRAIDDRLIDRSLAGDSAAYGDLVRRYQDRLRGSLMRLTGSAEESEDVAQEAFVQAFLKLSSFQRSSRFYTWIYRIAFNQAISKNRKRRPRVSLNAVQEAGGPEPTTDAANPVEPTLQGERAELLHAAIAQLEDDHRQVIVLREFEEMDYQQIAELIGAPIGTVRSRLFRARTQLRELLADSLGPTESDGKDSDGNSKTTQSD